MSHENPLVTKVLRPIIQVCNIFPNLPALRQNHMINWGFFPHYSYTLSVAVIPLTKIGTNIKIFHRLQTTLQILETCIVWHCHTLCALLMGHTAILHQLVQALKPCS